MAIVQSNTPLNNTITKGIEGTTKWGITALTYYFPTAADASAVTGELGFFGFFTPGTFVPIAATDPYGQSILAAFRQYERVAAVSFTQAASYSAADLKLTGNTFVNDVGTLGQMEFPGTNHNGSILSSNYESFLLLSTTSNSSDGQLVATMGTELGAANYRLGLALHELGHGLGLGHPHDTGNGTTAITDPAVVNTDNPLDNQRYTVMSYERGGLDTNLRLSFGHSASLSPLDVAALQHMYGATTNVNAGDTTYFLTDAGTTALDLDGSIATGGNDVHIGQAFFTIWDTSGTDSIQYAGANRTYINLNDATLSTTDDAATVALIKEVQATSGYSQLPDELQKDLSNANYHAGGFYSRIFHSDGTIDLGGYAIANGGVANAIENAKGGSGSDFLVGNERANELSGNGADDFLFGGAGADTLDGGTVGPHATSTSAPVSIPGSPEKYTIKLVAPNATDDATSRVAGTITKNGGSQHYNIAYVIDVSGSMGEQFSGNEQVPNLNGNTIANEKMDGAIYAFERLNASVVASGLTDANIAVIAFSDGASTVFQGHPDQLGTSLRSLQPTSGTNYESGLQRAIDFLSHAGPGQNVVFFISDGLPNGNPYTDEVATLTAHSGINAKIFAYGLGAGATTPELDQVDDGLANGTGISVLRPSQLASSLNASGSATGNIDHVEFYVNGVRSKTTLQPSDLRDDGFGLHFATELSDLKTTASDTIEARLVLKDAAHTTASTSVTVGNLSDDDVLVGGADNDIYQFAAGFGHDTIIESGGSADEIRVPVGLSGYRVMTNQADHNSLDIIIDDIDVITVRDFYLGGNNSVERIVFSDGSTSTVGLNTFGAGLTMAGTQSADFARGTDADDVISTYGGDDTIIGGSGAGNDFYDGGDGVDTVVYTSATLGVIVNLLATVNQASGSQIGIDQLVNIENVIGGSGNDQLTGDAQANRFTGGAGNNALDGGPGIDTVDYSGTPGPVTVNLAAGSAVNGFGGTDTLRNIENAVGSGFNDAFISDFHANRFDGGAGIDTVSYSASATGVIVDLFHQTTWDGSVGDTLSSIESVIGSGLNDTFYSSAAAERFNGGFGIDTVSYSASASGVIVDMFHQATWDGSVGDTLSGIENATGSAFSDTFYSSAAAERFDGGAGVDMVSYSASSTAVIVDLFHQATWDGSVGDALSGIEKATGSNFNDTFYSSAAAERFDGGAGIDTVSYSASASGVIVDLAGQATWDGGTGDTLSGIENGIGSSFNDTFYSRAGANRFDGGAGIDTVSYSASASGVIIDLAGQATWDGGSGDTLSSIENAIGSPFNDTFYSTAGANRFDGGAGIDAVSYAASSAGVIVDLFHQATWDGSVGDTLSSIENATGSNFNDTFYSSAGAERFDGGAGIDTVGYSASATGVIVDLILQATWDGAAGDKLSSIENAVGSSNNDFLYGDAGNNVLDGGRGGSDFISGGVGSDTVSYASSATGIIVDLAGQATWDGGTGDKLSGIENATGSSNSDSLYGDAGNNVLDGGAGGIDFISGGAGNDTVSYASSASGMIIDLAGQGTWDGGTGDKLSSIENAAGSSNSDFLYGDAGNNVLDGGRGGIDFISGGAGTDTVSCASSASGMIIDLTGQGTWDGGTGDKLSSIENAIGSSKNDFLYGDANANVLDGGAGIDSLTGAAGNDTFAFRKGEASGDIVVDFAGNGTAAGDQLQFTGYGTAAQGATLTAVDTTHWSINSADGLTHDIITLANGAAIHPSDYLFV